ncbi:MAG: MFS transporter [Acidobacteriota bacterium]|nr:MFS transporter [Acidobacteriota bacterium]MDH3524788.1 MFS transporter [Acidobacteriota bacterium]
MAPPKPAGRREIFAWAMFDFANSSYTTVIVTVAFGVFFTSAVAPAASADFLWGLALGVSNVLVLLTAPLIGAAADDSGRKKPFLAATYLSCVTATAGLYFVEPGSVAVAIALFVLSNIAFAHGENLIGAFLPEISTPANAGRISGLGWGLGYFGGLGSLLLIRPLMAAGLDSGNLERVRWIWPCTAGFFLVAALPTFLWLRERAPRGPWRGLPAYARRGFGRLRTTARSIAHFRELARFLTVFFVYSLGFTIAVAFSGIFARTTLGFSANELVALFLILQLSSAAGAVGFGWLQDRLGSRRTLQLSLVIWILVGLASAACQTKGQFLAIGLAAGIGIGSLQATSRGVVATFSPPSKSGEFFGFWGLALRAAFAIGPILFGLVSSWSGSQRLAVLVTTVFFAAGLVGLQTVDDEAGRAAARTWREPARPA